MNFAGLKNAKVSGRGVYLTPGEYDVEIVKAEIIHTRGQGDAFVVEFKVLTSNVEAHGVGTVRNYYQGLQDTDIAWPELKRFAWAVLGASTDADKAKVDENVETLFDAVDKGQQIFAGKKAHVSVIKRTTKKNQKVIDAATWTAYGS